MRLAGIIFAVVPQRLSLILVLVLLFTVGGILANLVLGEKVVPELLQQECVPERLAATLVPLLADGPERRRQLEAFARLDQVMELASARTQRRGVLASVSPSRAVLPAQWAAM